jgi:hypothetical protein
MIVGVCRLSPITFTSPSSKARQKSGSFPPPALPGFNGRTTLSDSRRCRHLQATVRPLPSHRTGLPRLPEPPFRRAEPTTPADQAGAHVDCFPAHAAFPKWQEGRNPHCHFRGLLRLYSRYDPPDRSAAHRRPLSRGSSPCGCPHEPLVSYRINRQLSGWILPPLMIRAFGAHCHNRTHALQHKTSSGRDVRFIARPPPRSVRAAFPHTAPASGV